jgi:MurNAc alpha-1-phosphate uridylyltransferase
MKAMILAAGLGTRMRPLTDHTPKPLLEAGGKPLIVWHIERLRDAGFVDLVINTAWLGDKLEAALGDGSQLGVRIQYSREGQPLETAGGIRQALPLLGDEPFLVVNGDIWTDIDFAALSLASALAEDDVATLVLVDNPEHNPDGDFVLANDGKVRDNLSDASNSCVDEALRLTFSGVGVYRPAFFAAPDDQDEARLGVLLRRQMQGDKVGDQISSTIAGRYHNGHWWDIGTPQRLAELDLFLRSQ